LPTRAAGSGSDLLERWAVRTVSAVLAGAVASLPMQRRATSLCGAIVLMSGACGDPTGTPATTVWMPTASAADGDDSSPGDDGGDDGTSAGDGGSDATDPDPTSPTGHTDDGHADDSGGPGDGVPELGATFTVIATAADGLDAPRDLEFAPEHPDQLWTANAGFHGVVILTDPGTPQQQSDARADYFGRHFMMTVSSIAFGTNNRFASCQESRDEWNGDWQTPDDFMGPTLWSADLDVFAMLHQGDGTGEGSHLDMLHQSPLCMGIAWESSNVFWAYDGLNAHLVRYDFSSDHGPGGTDHTDGSTRRYLNAVVQRRADVPGHMVVDPDARLLYVADTGLGRVMALDLDSGASNGQLGGNWDGVGDYSGWDGASWEPVVTGLSSPSGLVLDGDRIFVADFDTSEILAFDTGGNELGRVSTGAPGLMGLTMGPDGRLWYADGVANEIVRIDP
jgi:hypothetical protein